MKEEKNEKCVWSGERGEEEPRWKKNGKERRKRKIGLR